MVVVGEAYAEWEMLHRQSHRFAFRHIKHGDIFAMDLHIRPSEVQKRCYEGEARDVNQVAIVVKDMEISAEVEAFLPRNNAEGFGI